MVRNGALRNEQNCQRRSYGNLSGGAGKPQQWARRWEQEAHVWEWEAVSAQANSAETQELDSRPQDWL